MLERLGFGTTAGKAKVLGTLICIGGAMLLTFYKGTEIDIFSTNINLLHKSQPHRGGHVASSHEEGGDLGALLIVCCCFSAAARLIVQAVVVRLRMERDWNQWKLGWNIRLLTVIFTGIVASGVTCTFMAWVVQMRGPLFVSIFNPLMLVLVAIAGSLFLQEKLHLGSGPGQCPLQRSPRCPVVRSEIEDYNLRTCPDLPRQALLKSELEQRGSIRPTPSAVVATT
ncbi:unnamed protein product [Camellia sinensis]